MKREAVLLSIIGTRYTVSALPDLPSIPVYSVLCSGELLLRDSLLLCLLVSFSQWETSARDWRVGGLLIGQKNSFTVVGIY